MSFWNRILRANAGELPSPKFDLTDLVGKYQEMDPETEVLMPDGDHLKDGMRVLIENRYRPDLRDIESEEDYYNARVTNRWCTVENYLIPRVGNLVSFVGTYDDGTMVKRHYIHTAAWYVKRDSLPNSLTEASEEMLPLRRVNCQGEGCVGCSDCKVDGTDYNKQEITLNDLSSDDVALLLVTKGAIFGSGLTLPSGRFVTGQQMERLQREFEEH